MPEKYSVEALEAERAEFLQRYVIEPLKKVEAESEQFLINILQMYPDNVGKTLENLEDDTLEGADAYIQDTLDTVAVMGLEELLDAQDGRVGLRLA